jgi:hypothetical protein
MITFLNSAEDMQWLKDVHVRILPDNARSAIIFGNEDAPDSIEVYDSVQPLVTDTPIMSAIIWGNVINVITYRGESNGR